MEELKIILANLLPTIIEVGHFQIEQQNKLSSIEIKDKGLNQLVSFVDIESEKKIVSKCQELFPLAGFVTEEETLNVEHAEYNWIIDPLDGTTNFLHGLQIYSISVALVRNNEPILGIVHCPAMQQTFTAIKGEGAYLNNHSITCSPNKLLKDSLIATGFPYFEFEGMSNYLNLLAHLMKSTHGLRRMGSAAIDLAYTAMGVFDAFYETNLNAWDVAAGALLVSEAGGKVSDFKDKNNYLFGKQILAGNNTIHNLMLENINDFKL